MNFLLDANVILDRALKRARHVDVEEFLGLVTGDQLCISRFSLHTVGWFMTPRNPDGFRTVLRDLADSGVNVIDLSVEELQQVVDAMSQHKLDFDDAFNFVAAEKHDLTIVSSDADYDQTPRGRLSPVEAADRMKNR